MLSRISNKILRNHCGFHFDYFYFSKSKSLLVIKQHKARLSIEIINMIKKKPQKKALNSMCLTQNIIELIKKKEEYQQQSKQAVLSLFQGGIVLDQQIFNQDRINDGEILSKGISKFTFYPTYLVTSQIFEKIMEMRKSNKILQGQYGISKTVSVCLFWHLAKFIDQYRFEEDAEVIPQMLQIPKLFYISAMAKIDTLNEVKFIIERQSPQINKKLGKPLFSTQNLIKRIYIDNFPNLRNLKIILVFDQINILAKLDRIQKARMTNDQQKDSQKIRISQYIQQMKTALYHLRKHFSCILHLSSINLENKFQKQFNLSGSTGHNSTGIINIKYSELMFQNQTFYDLINYYLFQMEQRIFNQQQLMEQYQNNKEKIKGLCLKILQQQKPYFFITPLDIRYFITSNNYANISQIQSENLIQQTVLRFRNIVKESTDRYQKHLLNHFQKKDSKDQIRKNLMFEIFNQLTKIKKQNINQISKIIAQAKKQNLPTKKSNSVKISKKKSNQNAKKENQQKSVNNLKVDTIQFNQLFNFTEQQIQQFVDRRLFDIKEKKLKLLLPVDLILKVLVTHYIKHFDYILIKIQQFLSKYLRQGQFGNLIENLFLMVFNHGNVYFRIKLQGFYQDFHGFQDFNIKKDSIYGFLPLQYQQNKKKINFMNILKPSLIEMRQKKQHQGIILPTKIKHLNEDYNKIEQFRFLEIINSYSKSIDAIFVKFYTFTETPSINIFLLDLTTGKSETKDKIQIFTKQFLGFEDKSIDEITINENKFKVNLIYLVLGPDVSIAQQNMKENLNKSQILNQLKNKITFTILPKSNFLKVKQNYLLKKVGYLNLQNDIKFIKASELTVKELNSTMKTAGVFQHQQKQKYIYINK